MNLVLYTKNPTLQQFFKKALPPMLSQELFTEEQQLKEFLRKLTIPTQVILDKETYKLSLKAFLQQHKFHHIVCVSQSMVFEEILELLHYGSVLIHWLDLTSKDWWWNRSLMSFHKKKLTECPNQAVIMIPHTPVLKVRHFLESAIWRLFYEQKPKTLTLDISEPQHKSNELMTIFFNTLKKNNCSEPVAVFLKNFSLTSPRALKQFLLNYSHYEQSLDQLRLFIYFDNQHSNFERAFDHCSSELSSPLFRLDCRKVDRISQKLLTTAQTDDLYHHMAQSLIMESVELSWKSSLLQDKSGNLL